MKYVILDFQHIIPAFIVDIAEEIVKQDNDVVFITAVINNKNDEYKRAKRCGMVYEVDSKEIIRGILHRPRFLFKAEVTSDLKRILFNSGRERGDLFTYLKQVMVSNVLAFKAAGVIKEWDASKTIVLATWFHVEAYAAALMKQVDSKLTVVSLAHSFEVNPDRNKYVDCMQNAFRHTHIDRIFFISEIIRTQYLKKIKESIALDVGNTEVQYLGSYNRNHLKNPIKSSDDSSKIIVTCSNCVKLKRLDILMNCFEEEQLDNSIRWIHIGDGPEFNRLNKSAEQVNNRRGYQVISFLGRLGNVEVLDIYGKKHIDVFLNISTVEGLPISIMEALSYGVPVIATNVGGTSEILDDNCGRLIDKNIDAHQLSAIINEFITNEPLQIEYLRNNAYQKWSIMFNAECNISKLVIKMGKLVERNRHENTSY